MGTSVRQPAQARRAPAVVRTCPGRALSPAVVAAVLVVLVILGADGPLRADHDYWAAYSSLRQPAPGSATANTSASQSTQVGPAYFADLKSSFALNPWEPSYKTEEASVLTSAAATRHHPVLRSAATWTRRRGLLAQAVAEKPLWAPYPAAAAEVYADLAEVEPADAPADLATAASLVRKAMHDNPRDTAYPALLSQIVAHQHQKASK